MNTTPLTLTIVDGGHRIRCSQRHTSTPEQASLSVLIPRMNTQQRRAAGLSLPQDGLGPLEEVPHGRLGSSLEEVTNAQGDQAVTHVETLTLLPLLAPIMVPVYPPWGIMTSADAPPSLVPLSSIRDEAYGDEIGESDTMPGLVSGTDEEYEEYGDEGDQDAVWDSEEVDPLVSVDDHATNQHTSSSDEDEAYGDENGVSDNTIPSLVSGTPTTNEEYMEYGDESDDDAAWDSEWVPPLISIDDDATNQHTSSNEEDNKDEHDVVDLRDQLDNLALTPVLKTYFHDISPARQPPPYTCKHYTNPKNPRRTRWSSIYIYNLKIAEIKHQPTHTHTHAPVKGWRPALGVCTQPPANIQQITTHNNHTQVP
jgi:hypothetical protein